MRNFSTFLVLITAISGIDAADTSKPPHVVLFLADDLGIRDCSPYGGKDVDTPNMTKLAKEGMVFSRAFVASPSCAPSRAALLTGMDPMRNGAMLNHARPKAELKKWPKFFQELGYEVVAIGKVAHYAQVTDYGFDHASHFKYHEDTCIAEAVTWLAGRKSTKPLCLLVGTNWPHVPWPKEGVNPKASLPPTLVDTPETRHARSRYFAAVANADRDIGLISNAVARHLGDNVLFAFTSDHGSQFPFGKWNCYDAGVHTPLIVKWPGQIKAGSTTDAMVGWIDLLPTLLSVCGGKPPADLSGTSFHKVLSGDARTHRDKVFFTHSGDGAMNRYPIRAVRTEKWKYIRNLDPAASHTTHVDKGNEGTDGRLYFDSWVQKAKTNASSAEVVKRYHTRPSEELYDIQNDTWEMKNLVDDPKHAETLKTLRSDLDQWMKANGDRGLETEKALPNPQAKK